MRSLAAVTSGCLALGLLLLPSNPAAAGSPREDRAKAEAKYVEETSKARAKRTEEEAKARAKTIERRAKGRA